MVSGIQPLGADLVHRIAAGEVIDSLAAVVRELIENALDAGASRIVVTLWPQEWRVRVTDNGRGLNLIDLQQAAAPHSTSKIRCSEDLARITTLGFRGEALHSLAHLGTLEICSRTASEPQGWRLVYTPEGKPSHCESIAIAPGTIVTVSHLFLDWPARRQALPAPAQQLRAIQAVIHQSALCHPRVTWQVLQNQRPWFNIAPGKTAQQILPQILSSVQPADLRGDIFKVKKVGDVGANLGPAVEAETPSQIEVVVGLPDRCHRQRPDWVRVAVNGRCVRVSGAAESWNGTGLRPLAELEQAIFHAFRQTLPRHRYPLCWVHLRLAPDQIDWNRHPAKAEIYLRQAHFWSAEVAQAIQQVLQLPELPSAAGQTDPVRQLIRSAEAKGFYSLNRSISLPTAAHPESGLNSLRAVGQVHNTYILAEHPGGLWLVEQHIAHERVLYEQLVAEWKLVELNPPLILSHLKPAQVAQLQQLEIAIAPFGNHLWAVRSAPELLAQRDDCAAALVELSLGENLQAALVATACRSAIRNGMPLSLEEMQALLEQWQRTRQPRTCPHGRPIYLSLAETDLARFFSPSLGNWQKSWHLIQT